MEITYKEFIDNIIESRGRHGCGEEYHEVHHIIPKCIGGSNDESNLIDLFAKEHFEAHRLLVFENPDNDKLVYAWTCMAFLKNKNQKRHKITPEEYEEAKMALSNMQYLKMTGTNNPFYGKNHTQDTRDKIREWNKSRGYVGENHPWFGCKHTDTEKEKMRKKRPNCSGGNNHNAKYVLCIDTRIIYNAVIIASRQTGISRGNICSCCLGKRNKAGGYQWKYLYDQTCKDGTIIPGAITLGLITEEEALKQLSEQKAKISS